MQKAIEHIRSRSRVQPLIGVVLGSGLGAFADELSDRIEMPYSEIPDWPQSTAVGHAGKLVVGSFGGLPVAVMSGRAHLYEGHSMDKVVFGTRVLARLGVKAMVYTNAAGGINLSYSQGALVLVSDHINLQGSSPLIGPNDDTLGPRFPDMSDAYDAGFRKRARAVAERLGIALNEGVYAGLLGPSYETPAEIRYLRAIGADLVGMSTVPEVIAARHMDVRCMAISCVTNMAAGILPRKINHEEVLETGARVRGRLVHLLQELLPEVAAEVS
ncbi:MAG: purine-nucleoside phosphorylase [Acidobacteriia bacterium]|nr:purine-nucleoside phosphorylase [Terriglobia bacterium]